MNLKAKSWSSSLWCSIAKSCPTLYDSMDCSMPGFPVLHYLPEFAQVHVHWFGDAIEPSYLLFPSSPFTFNLSQHQSLSIESAFCIRCPKHWSFSFSISPSSECSGLISLRINWFDLPAVQGLSRIFSSITIWKIKFFDPQSSLQSNHLIHTWLLETNKQT